MHLLNPTLYHALLARFGDVGIAKEGEQNTHIARPNWQRGGKLQRRVASSGQYFAICCPFCGDQRRRLWINHEWGVRDTLSGNDNLHLAICFNEQCLRTRGRQLQLQRMLAPFDDEWCTLPAPVAAVSQDTWAPPVSELCLPQGSVPITELFASHPALAYLLGRNFNVQELWDQWRIHYCEHSPFTNPPFDQRIVIPIHQPGSSVATVPQLVGWAARSITSSPSVRRKYLFNAGLRASRVLYGLNPALPPEGPVVVVEGPADVWRVGPGAVAMLGKSLSTDQKTELLRLAQGRPIVVMLDRDASSEARKIRDSLRSGRARGAGDRRVVIAQVPGGAKDPGESTREQVWEAVSAALTPAAVAPPHSPVTDVPPGEPPLDWTIEPEGPSMLNLARDYMARGFRVVPQHAGEKRPCIPWKEHQNRPPTESELVSWFKFHWPNAGMAVVLGQDSGVFAIDVDGAEAHDVLLSHLGKEPFAPKVLSGSGKPFRYHLFFRHPKMQTGPKLIPWHEHLEFRGDGGIVVLPPSEHKSGKRYAWAPGRSLGDLSLPQVPKPILEALATNSTAIKKKPK